MERISNIIGKPVISIFDGTLEGYAKNVVVDKRVCKIEWIEIFDDETQEEKLLLPKGICKFGKDAIMLKNNEAVYLKSTILQSDINIVGCDIFCTDGCCLGKVQDICFDDNFSIESLILQNEQAVLKSEILIAGTKILIARKDDAVKISNYKPKRKILLQNLTAEQKVTIQQTPPKKASVPIARTPKKILTAGYEFLIGRKVGQNIFADNKQLIVKKQCKITSEIIDIASKNGKLKELTTYSLI